MVELSIISLHLSEIGEEVRFVDSTRPEEFKKAVYIEDKSNLRGDDRESQADVPDFEAIARIAHDAGVPFVVDNTVGVGLVRPIDYEQTSRSSRHEVCRRTRTSIGGVIVDSGKFDWVTVSFPSLQNRIRATMG